MRSDRSRSSRETSDSNSSHVFSSTVLMAPQLSNSSLRLPRLDDLVTTNSLISYPAKFRDGEKLAATGDYDPNCEISSPSPRRPSVQVAVTKRSSRARSQFARLRLHGYFVWLCRAD